MNFKVILIVLAGLALGTILGGYYDINQNA
jgi:hypothetical protein